MSSTKESDRSRRRGMGGLGGRVGRLRLLWITRLTHWSALRGGRDGGDAPVDAAREGERADRRVELCQRSQTVEVQVLGIVVEEATQRRLGDVVEASRATVDGLLPDQKYTWTPVETVKETCPASSLP